MLTAFLANAVFAQESSSRLEIGGIHFRGTNAFNDGRLLSAIRSRESPNWFWKFLYHSVSENLGQQPEYFDPLTFSSDVHQLALFYREHGFYAVTVDTSIVRDLSSRSIDLTFHVNEGPRSVIDSIRYLGLNRLSDELREEIESNKFIEQGDPFSVELDRKSVV